MSVRPTKRQRFQMRKYLRELALALRNGDRKNIIWPRNPIRAAKMAVE